MKRRVRPPNSRDPWTRLNIRKKYQLDRLEAYLQGRDDRLGALLHFVFGKIPDWSHGPRFEDVKEITGELLNLGLSGEEIKTLVVGAGRNKLQIPAVARDVESFSRSMRLLALFYQGLSLAKRDRLQAFRLIHGDLAVHGLHGRKFKSRKPGSYGPIRKAITKLLARDPNMSNFEVWRLICDDLPKGWAAFDNRCGKYLDGPQSKDGKRLHTMQYPRFCNVCAEVRNVLKAKITV